MSAAEETVLVGGRSAAEVIRIGDIVHRTVGPRAGFAHAVLRHLETCGFPGAPRLTFTTPSPGRPSMPARYAPR